MKQEEAVFGKDSYMSKAYCDPEYRKYLDELKNRSLYPSFNISKLVHNIKANIQKIFRQKNHLQK